MNDASLKYRKSKPLTLLKETSTYYIVLKLDFLKNVLVTWRI